MLILDDPRTWPPQLIRHLNQKDVVDLLRKHDYIDRLVSNPIIQRLLSYVEDAIASTQLAAYHCSKQLPERPYSATGLRPLNFEQHHAELRELLRERPVVSPSLYAKLDSGLKDWQANHTGRRETLLWFCLDRPLVVSPGTKDFFKYFGGEAVYFALKSDPEIAALLQALGEPVVVEARISSKDLKTYQEYPFARTLVSYFARSLNPEFNIEHREGQLSKPVPPSDIVAVHPLEKFRVVIGQREA